MVILALDVITVKSNCRGPGAVPDHCQARSTEGDIALLLYLPVARAGPQPVGMVLASAQNIRYPTLRLAERAIIQASSACCPRSWKEQPRCGVIKCF